MDWEAVAEKFYWETETYEGGGVVLYPDGHFEVLEDHLLDFSGGVDCFERRDDLYYYHAADGTEVPFWETPYFDKELSEGFGSMRTTSHVQGAWVEPGNEGTKNAAVVQSMAEKAGFPEHPVFFVCTSDDPFDNSDPEFGRDGDELTAVLIYGQWHD